MNLPESTLIQLDSLNANTAWETLGTPPPPQNYFIRPDGMVIGLYPYISTFTASQGLGNLLMKYYAQPADLVNGSDTPFNGITRLFPYHMLLPIYTAYRVYLTEGEVDKANLYLQEYVSRIDVMANAVGKKPNYVPGFTGPANSR